MRKFHLATVLLGTALLCFLIWEIGPETLWHEFRQMGWRLAPFIVIEGVIKFLHTIAWRHCLPRPYSSLSISRLYKIYLAGGAINYFTPTATIGGEVVKGTLLASEYRGPGAATGVIVGKLAYALSQFSVALVGSIIVIWKIPLPSSAYMGLLAGNIILSAGLVGFLIVQRKGKLNSVFGWVASKQRGENLRRVAESITRVDQDLRRFYQDNPQGLPAAVGWHVIGFFFSMLKTWYFLALFTDDLFLTAAAIWLLSTWLDLLVFFIPLEIGLQESIRMVVFNVLGFSMALGLTYGIALRLEQLCWGIVGLLVYAVFSLNRQTKDIFKTTTREKQLN